MLTNEELSKNLINMLREHGAPAQEKLHKALSIVYTLEQALSHVHDSGEKNPPIYEFIVLLGMQKDLLSDILQTSDDVMREFSDVNRIFGNDKLA